MSFTLNTPNILPLFPIYTHNKQKERERERPRLVSLNIISSFMYSFWNISSAYSSVYNSVYNSLFISIVWLAKTHKRCFRCFNGKISISEECFGMFHNKCGLYASRCSWSLAWQEVTVVILLLCYAHDPGAQQTGLGSVRTLTPLWNGRERAYITATSAMAG